MEEESSYKKREEGRQNTELLVDAVKDNDKKKIIEIFELYDNIDINFHGYCGPAGPGKPFTTPLSEAIDNGNYEIAKILLDNGADPNDYASYYDMTILQYAYEYKNDFEFIELLLDYGANSYSLIDVITDSLDYKILKKIGYLV